MLKRRVFIIACVVIIGIGFVAGFSVPDTVYAGENEYIMSRISELGTYMRLGDGVPGFNVRYGPVVYNLSECMYVCGDRIYYRNIPAEQTYVLQRGRLRTAQSCEERQMSIDVWNIAGVETRRKQLLSKDMADGFYFGVSGCNFWLNQPVPSGNTDESKEGCNDTEKYTDTEKQKKKNGEENEPSVPTPPPTPQPEPEVPIVDPVVE